MPPDFAAAVSAITYSIARERCAAHVDDPRFPHNRVARAVLAQYAVLPDFLRAGVWCGTLALEVLTIAVAGRPFHALDHERRWRRLERWRRARLAPFRDLVRFFECLVVFGWYDVTSDPDA